MRGCRNLTLVCLSRLKCLYFTAAKGCRMAQTVEADEGKNSVNIRLLSSLAVVKITYPLAKLVYNLDRT